MALVRADNRWNRQDLEKAKRQSEARSTEAEGRRLTKFHEEAEGRFAPIRFPPQQGYIPGES